MMDLNKFIDGWNRITIHQIVHLLNNITVFPKNLQIYWQNGE